MTFFLVPKMLRLKDLGDRGGRPQDPQVVDYQEESPPRILREGLMGEDTGPQMLKIVIYITSLIACDALLALT